MKSNYELEPLEPRILLDAAATALALPDLLAPNASGQAPDVGATMPDASAYQEVVDASLFADAQAIEQLADGAQVDLFADAVLIEPVVVEIAIPPENCHFLWLEAIR